MSQLPGAVSTGRSFIVSKSKVYQPYGVLTVARKKSVPSSWDQTVPLPVSTLSDGLRRRYSS